MLLCTLFLPFLSVAFTYDCYSFTFSLKMHWSLCRIHLRLLLFHFLDIKCMRSPSSFSLSLSPPTATLSLSRFHFRLNRGFKVSTEYIRLRFYFRLNSGFKAGFRPNSFGFSAPCPFPSLSRCLPTPHCFLFVAFNSDCCSFTFSLSNAFGLY
jgi:hypothetical protein